MLCLSSFELHSRWVPLQVFISFCLLPGFDSPLDEKSSETLPRPGKWHAISVEFPCLYTDVVLFFFSLFSKTSASSRAKRECEKGK